MKTYRIYFNQHAEYPLVWSFDTGDGTEETKVPRVLLSGYTHTCYRGLKDDTQPRAWFEVKGVMFRREDCAYFIGR